MSALKKKNSIPRSRGFRGIVHCQQSSFFQRWRGTPSKPALKRHHTCDNAKTTAYRFVGNHLKLKVIEKVTKQYSLALRNVGGDHRFSADFVALAPLRQWTQLFVFMAAVPPCRGQSHSYGLFQSVILPQSSAERDQNSVSISPYHSTTLKVLRSVLRCQLCRPKLSKPTLPFNNCLAWLDMTSTRGFPCLGQM